LLAGSFFNIISAWICLFCILFFFGIVNFSPIIGSVLEKSPAQINNLQEGDIINSINGKKIKFFSDIADVIHKSKRVKIDIIRGNKILSKEFDLLYNEELEKYFIGISSTDKPDIEKYSFRQSLKQSIFFIPSYYLETFKYIYQSYKSNTLTKELAGPIGMVKMADQLMLDKIKGVLFIFIMISLFVGLFNLVPIPLLDGGHIVYFLLRSFFSNSLPAYVTRIYLITGITIISFLFIIITFNDIFYK
jgi:regulator of sigma E protease